MYYLMKNYKFQKKLMVFIEFLLAKSYGKLFDIFEIVDILTTPKILK